MKKSERISLTYLLACLLTVMLLITSCIKDDQDDCGLDITFRYTYNMKNADAFTQDASKVTLYIFSKDGKFLRQQTADKSQLRNGNTMHVSNLNKGDYRFVAFAQSTTQTADMANFLFSQLSTGKTYNDLTAQLQTESKVSKTKLNNLLNGTLDANVTGVAQTLSMDMKKLTNTLRIILVPYGEGSANYLNAANYDFKVTDNNTLLGYDGTRLSGDSVTYTPYLAQTATDDASTTGTYSAVVAEMSFSRLFADAKSRLVIRDKINSKDVIDINLTWFLALTEIEEHRSAWSTQEYLDRQDEYSMEFFVNTSGAGSDNRTWMLTRIVVNGWVLNLSEIQL
jgi:hypothetical protein